MKFRYKLKELLAAYELTYAAVSRETGINEDVVARLAKNHVAFLAANNCSILMKFFRLENLEDLIELVPEEAVEMPTKRREAERELIAA